MTLQMRLAREEVLVGESLFLRVSYTNAGPGEASLPALEPDGGALALALEGPAGRLPLSFDAMCARRGEDTPFFERREVRLAAGASMEARIDLLERSVHDLPPGQYTLAARYQGERVERPLRVEPGSRIGQTHLVADALRVGGAPARLAWSSGGVILLRLCHHANPRWVAAGERVAELAAPPEAGPWAARNVIPGQPLTHVLWQAGGALFAVPVRDGEPGGAAALPLPAGSALVAPPTSIDEGIDEGLDEGLDEGIGEGGAAGGRLLLLLRVAATGALSLLLWDGAAATHVPLPLTAPAGAAVRSYVDHALEMRLCILAPGGDALTYAKGAIADGASFAARSIAAEPGESFVLAAPEQELAATESGYRRALLALARRGDAMAHLTWEEPDALFASAGRLAPPARAAFPAYDAALAPIDGVTAPGLLRCQLLAAADGTLHLACPRAAAPLPFVEPYGGAPLAASGTWSRAPQAEDGSGRHVPCGARGRPSGSVRLFVAGGEEVFSLLRIVEDEGGSKIDICRGPYLP